MEHTLELPPGRVIAQLFGVHDANLRYIEEHLSVAIRAHENVVTIAGVTTAVELATKLLEGAYRLLEAGIRLDIADLRFLTSLLENGEDLNPGVIRSERIAIPCKKGFVSPKSLGQRRYIQAIRRHDVVVGIGPAGTGKTYLAMAAAVAELEQKRCSRIILARPAVEAGERLGFLPGDLLDKVNPYLRPLYDALYDMVEFDEAQRLIERGSHRGCAPGVHAWPNPERFVHYSRRGAERHH